MHCSICESKGVSCDSLPWYERLFDSINQRHMNICLPDRWVTYILTMGMKDCPVRDKGALGSFVLEATRRRITGTANNWREQD